MAPKIAGTQLYEENYLRPPASSVMFSLNQTRLCKCSARLGL